MPNSASVEEVALGSLSSIPCPRTSRLSALICPNPTPHQRLFVDAIAQAAGYAKKALRFVESSFPAKTFQVRAEIGFGIAINGPPTKTRITRVIQKVGWRIRWRRLAIIRTTAAAKPMLMPPND